ncbi:MAG: hypothetical protein AAB307_01660, partial [Deltaproteobacteria bacterium]
MADETEKPKKEDQEKKPAVPAKGNKKILLIAIAAVVVAGLGAGAFFFLKGKPANPASAETPKAASAEEGSHGEAEKSDPHGSSGEAKKSDPHGSSEEAKKGDAHGSPEAAKNNGSANLLALDPFIVNLQDNSGTR